MLSSRIPEPQRRTSLVLLLVFMAPLLALAQQKQPVDYQELARTATWGWSPENDDLLYSIDQAGEDYTIVVVSTPRSRHLDVHECLEIRVLAGDQMRYSWQGAGWSVFRIRGDRLYYADYSVARRGGTVVAVDLKTGKVLWRSSLLAVGPVMHSKYSNRITLAADEDAICVWGQESAGRYLEYKDANTGKTIGHRIFDPPQSSGK